VKVIKSAGGKVTAPIEHWEEKEKKEKFESLTSSWEKPRRRRGKQGRARHGRKHLTPEELKAKVKVMIEIPGYLLQVLDKEADELEISRTRVLTQILEKIYGDSAWEGFLLAIPPKVNNYEDEEPLIVKQIREELERKKEYETERHSTEERGPGEGDLPQWWGDRAVPGEPFGDTGPGGERRAGEDCGTDSGDP
jgi:hypothetical protein